MEKNLKKRENIDLINSDKEPNDNTNPMSLFYNPFISFRYSYKSISSDGERTHIQASENRFKNGKFESEEFEGTMDKNVYDQMVGEMNRYFEKQMELFFKPFTMFLK
jgi:hypothetical protein